MKNEVIYCNAMHIAIGISLNTTMYIYINVSLANGMKGGFQSNIYLY